MDKLWYTYAIEYYSAIFKKLAFILQKDMARYCSLKKKNSEHITNCTIQLHDILEKTK